MKVLPRSRISLILDWLAFVFAAASVWIAVTGGAVFRIAGARITARSADRALLAALLIILLRIVIDRRTRPFASLGGVAVRLRDRIYDPARDEPAPLDPSTRWWRRGLATIGLCIVAVVLLYPQLQRMDAVPDLGDPLFSIWRFGWVVQKLQGDPRPLFSPNIFYPHPLTLTYSDSMLLPALTTAPLVVAGLHPLYAYNAVLVLSFIVSGIATYVLVEKLTGSPAAAFVSALLFGFYPYRFEHYSHFELQMTYCMPLALLALHRVVSTARIRDGLAAGLLSAGQLYSSMYYAVFFTLYVSVVFTVESALRRASWRRLAVPALAGAAVALILALPLARTYSQARLGDRDADTVAYYSATAADYLRAHPRSAMWGERSLPGRQPERALFPGVMILLLAALALIPPIGITRTVYTAGLVTAFEISRGFNGILYPILYDSLPFMRGLRVPARCSVLVGLSMAVLAGFAVRRLVAGRSPGAVAASVGALTVAIAIDLRPVLRLESVWREPPPIYGTVASTPNVVLAEFPFGGNTRKFTPNMPYLYFSLWHWANMVNGYSGHTAPGQDDFEKAIGPFPAESALDLLRARGVTHVTVNCALYNDGCGTFLDRVQAAPRLKLLISGMWEGHPVLLYELR